MALLRETPGKSLSAQDIFVALRNRNTPLGLATVYRTLKQMQIEGLVFTRAVAGDRYIYCLVGDDKHYMTCLRCERSTPLDACPLEKFSPLRLPAENFEVFYHTLEFFGLCSVCQHQLHRGA